VLVLTGVLIQTGRYAPPSWIGPAILLVGGVPLVWAGLRQLRPLDDSGSRALFIEEGAGAYRGMAIGESREVVMRALGRTRPSTGSIAPLGQDFDEIGGPPFIATPGVTHEVLRYADTTVLLTENGVYGYVITADDAETVAGVGIGDNLGVVEDRYQDLECGIARAGEYRTFPYCGGMLGSGRWIWFGQDPIRSIVVTRTALGPD
jgi:hypothetical protein